MKNIKKQEKDDYQLNKTNRNPPANATEAKSRWKNYRYKKTLGANLKKEQYSLCAYSEIRPDLMGLNTHIEHIQPKSKYPCRTFDYSNLVLSALSSEDLKSLARQDVFGGHSKLSEYDPVSFISCLKFDCFRYFSYLSTGFICAHNKLSNTDKIKAEKTITLLNLNSPYLVVKRKEWLDELDKLIDDHLHDSVRLKCLASIYLLPYGKKLDPFFSLSRQRFNQLAEQLLKDKAPELL